MTTGGNTLAEGDESGYYTIDGTRVSSGIIDALVRGGKDAIGIPSALVELGVDYSKVLEVVDPQRRERGLHPIGGRVSARAIDLLGSGGTILVEPGENAGSIANRMWDN